MHFWQAAFRPIDNSQLILFRIFFGFLMFFESIGAIITGWVKETFVTVHMTFPFHGFEWTQALLGPQMYAAYVLMGIFGLGIAFGYRYRASIIGFTLIWSLTYFMQKTHYNNHYYLIMLIAFMMVFMPANRYKSMDVKRNPTLLSNTCPQWCTWSFMIMVSIVYIYASIAKLYPDWLNCDPVSIWFTARKDYPIVGNFLQHDWLHCFVSYAGIGFDLLIVPMLLWRRTRWLAIISSLMFHLFNSAVFQIGVFPYFALSFAVFFFPVDQVRRRFFRNKASTEESNLSIAYPRWPAYIMAAFLIVQFLLPLRHHLIPGNVLWDESGHRLAWRMMLRTKSGYASFQVKADGEEFRVSNGEYLKPHQFSDVYTKPDLIWTFAQRLRKEYEARGYEDVSVYCKARVGVNKRPAEQFTNDSIDIANTKWNYFGRQPWIVPASWE